MHAVPRLRAHPILPTLAIFAIFGFIGREVVRAADTKAVDADHAAKMARGLELFKKDVRAVLLQRCFRCHGGKSTESELDITDRDRLLHGGGAGPAVVPGNAKGSLLYQLVVHARAPHMPHNAAKLPAETIAQLAAWIDAGAPYDKPLRAAKAEEVSWTEKQVPETARAFWSFQPLRRVAPPRVQHEAWVHTPIDRFILARLEAAGLTPSPPAERRLLLRRVYFDLIGLPPTPEEADAFLNDASPDAWEKLIDRLLASPHYGERWGRHWLDLARFAESHGFEHDYDRPTAYPYRDFVIRALNDDLPFDTFVKWQLAGDELAPDDPLAQAATGFLAAGVHSTQITKNEVERQRYDELDDMLATTGTAMLGLTVGCARCHDHKFDPIPQRDYYRLLATFTTTVRSEVDVNVDPDNYRTAKAAFDREHAGYEAALKRFEVEQIPARLTRWERAGAARPERFPWIVFDLTMPGVSQAVRAILRTPAERRTPAQAVTLAKWYRAIDPDWQKLYRQNHEHLRRAPKPPLVRTMIATEGLPAVRLHTQGADFLPQTHFLRRGDSDQKERIASAGFLQVVTTAPEQHWHGAPPTGWRTSYRRRDLAAWLTDVDQGAGRLVARVIVNRLWQHHLGRGIVATPSEFGHRGEPPTHPELLDWLATELIRNGWRLKPIHKLIMLSAVYQQRSSFDEAKARVDRDNRLFWRRPRGRLEAETIRDSLLAIGGVLDPTLYGPGTLDEGSRRRSIYFTVKRSQLIPMMQVFDAPEALSGVGDRPTTTIAPQALLLLNNAHVRAAAQGFARRTTPTTSDGEAIQHAYRIALSRLPTNAELAEATAFLRQQTESYRTAGQPDPRTRALADFCQAVLCLNELVYVD